MKMAEHDLGALVCFVGENVRYITSVFQGNWKNNIFIRYCVLPRDGDPMLFETAGSDSECAKIDAPWLEGNIRPAMAVLKENGVERERIGIDILKPGVRESTITGKVNEYLYESGFDFVHFVDFVRTFKVGGR